MVAVADRPRPGDPRGAPPGLRDRRRAIHLHALLGWAGHFRLTGDFDRFFTPIRPDQGLGEGRTFPVNRRPPVTHGPPLHVFQEKTGKLLTTLPLRVSR